jgi:hypothetical protein
LTYSLADAGDPPNDLGILPAINAYWLERDTPPFKSSYFYDYAGTKEPECEILIGAFNGMFLDEFLTHLRSLPWNEPECVQIFIQDQEATIFTLYAL